MNEVQRWVQQCLREDKASYGRDTGFSYHGETLGISHFTIASYSTLDDHATQRAFYEYLQQTLEMEFPESTYEEYYRFPGASWGTSALTLDSTNEPACERAFYLLTDFEGSEKVFRKLEEKYKREEAITSIRACKPKHLQKDPEPKRWAERVATWLDQNDYSIDDDAVQEAAFSLGFLTMLYCENGCMTYVSNTKDHWSYYIDADSSGAAHDRYHTWLQTVTAQTISPVIEGFVRTFDPYPTQGENEYGEQIIDYIDGKHICPHCGAEMVEKQ